MTTTSADPTPRIQSEPALPAGSLSGEVAVTAAASPGAWLESDIAKLKDIRARTLVLAEESAGYDTRLRRMFTDVEAEIRKALAALLLQREDQDDNKPKMTLVEAAQTPAFQAGMRDSALCPACKQPQSSPSCERREHWSIGPEPFAGTIEAFLADPVEAP